MSPVSVAKHFSQVSLLASLRNASFRVAHSMPSDQLHAVAADHLRQPCRGKHPVDTPSAGHAPWVGTRSACYAQPDVFINLVIARRGCPASWR